MSAGFINGIVTAVLLVLFVGLVLWAWSGKRKADFDRAARLPLEDDPKRPNAAGDDNHNNGRPS